jgi:hypothetical protein
MITDQLFTVAASVNTQSRTHSVQLPFGVANNGGQVATFEKKPVGPVPTVASAEKVPVNGGAAAPKPVPPSEKILVLTKLSPAPPRRSTRFRLAPLGARIPKVRSPSHVIATLFSFTATSTIVALPGMPATFILLVTPAALPSGTAKAVVEL